ncbi:baseplate J/gp47 family protein [Kordia sp.]|uniref:baseplate J/gp47 family protein n=1 Tax=Kordia sp. TaxID=1965332 RepID=UPI003B5AEB2D
MQNDCTENTLIKLREGTTQQERYHALLDPENVELMGFGVKDWMNFAEEFSKHVQLFTNKDFNTPNGTWEPFHNASKEIKEVIETYTEGDITPQLALFIAFLKLLNKSKERFNKITKRHLDFYYKEVLQLAKKDEKADHAYVIFELAKTASEQFLSEETLVKAGKDSEGNTIHYKLEDEIVLNKAKIAAIRNTYAYPNVSNWHASSIANSADGEGGEDENGVVSWLPFGDMNRNLAKKGFSLTAPSLLLTEGKRNITITAAFKTLTSEFDLQSILSIEHTGEKGWVTLPATVIKNASTKSKILTIEIQLSEEDEKIVNYDVETHEGKYATTHPIIRVLFAPEDKTTTTYNRYLKIAKAELDHINISTEGEYTAGLTVKNDLGKIKTDNPFYPFGPLAKKRAKLKISAEEWIGKNISDIEVSLDWKDYPDNFQAHYQHYLSQYLNITPPTTFLQLYNGTNKTQLVTDAYGSSRFRVMASYIGDSKSRAKTATDQSYAHSEDESDALNYDHSETEATEETPSISQDEIQASRNQQMFFGVAGAKFKNFLPPQTNYIPKKTDDYFIQLSLQNNFLHDAFARIYTYHALNKFALPNNAYAPLAENLKVKVTTIETIRKNTKHIGLYHELPFGIQEVAQSELTLMPAPEDGGQLYIGIENAIADQNIQFLCQIEEGSENPDAIEAYGEAKVTWQYLHKNTWHNLKSKYLLKDQTDNFLKAGLVAFTVPKQFGDTTLFAEDHLWIRATISNAYNTVSKFSNIHTQAVEVKFLNNENTLEHLDKGMPAETISKLEERLATVKKVTQPYASFDGLPKESDLDFYRRVSERLRHKNRAITLWDYEHLVLQEFNYLHKIKCLNHSTSTSFKAPGEVLLVAIPNIIDQNVYDIYKPKLSQAKLNAIQNYVNKLNTMHVKANVVSPVYEPVTITLSARFYEGLDANFYTKELRTDLAQYLSPWAFDKNQPISFGNALYASEVIFYIENLDYVDYIKDFKMLHDGDEKDEIIPTDQKSILTSVEPDSHTVNAITTAEC